MARKTQNKYNHYAEDLRREAVQRSDDPNASAAEVKKQRNNKTPIAEEITNNKTPIAVKAKNK